MTAARHPPPSRGRGFQSNFSRTLSQGWELLTSSLMERIHGDMAREPEGHWHLARQDEMFKQATRIGRELAQAGDHLVVCGIGGSGLGVRAFSQWVLPVTQWDRVTVLDHIDPAVLSEWGQTVDLSRCVFCVTSKSGKTIETLSQWLWLHHLLKQRGLSVQRIAERVVVISNPEKNPLTTYADHAKLRHALIPKAVGGRFSVLSSVGLIPLAFLGVDLSVVQESALQETRHFEAHLKKKGADTSALQDAATWAEAYHQGIRQWVLMSYSKKFFSFTLWAAQLIAESLGKPHPKSGAVGLLPLPAQGVTDQHSYLQFLLEGPPTTMTTFFEFPFQEPLATGPAQSTMKDPLWGTLAQRRFSQIHQTECEATLHACDQRERPYQRLQFSSSEISAVVQWVIYFQQLVAALGFILGINPYDQPGVEIGKQETLRRLAKE